MGKTTKIEWTNSSWNPWHGCKKVSPGCKNCYMYRGKKRFGNNPGEVLRSKTTFNDPLKWSNARLIFTCSWSDWFIEEADNWRDEAWDIIRNTPRHTYQILTKRPERILEHLPKKWGDGWDNVWLGVSIENQDYLFRKDLLIDIPSKVRFLSLEPLLGPIKLHNLESIHWIITGGESGPNARNMDKNWVINIKEQCDSAGIPFFHKQNGGHRKIEGAWGGRKVQGKIWHAMPSLNISS